MVEKLQVVSDLSLNQDCTVLQSSRIMENKSPILEPIPKVWISIR